MSAGTVAPAEVAPQHVESGIGDEVRAFVAKVRGGDVGSLPAVLGLVVLVAVFSALRPETFTNAFNFANLIHQAVSVMVIAMGLVFVLLLGEIDLAAGFTAGTAAAVLGILATQRGLPWYVAVVGCLVTGAVIGAIIGLLVARLGIPSFVVTLAAFLALQGVLLRLIGEGGTVSINNDTLLAINNNDLPVWAGWVLYVLVVAGSGLLSLRRLLTRRRTGLRVQSMQVWAIKTGALALLLGLVTYYLSIERSPNPLSNSLKGVPVVVVLMLLLLVGLTFVLTRTAFGRHVYATGGNMEAARRAGINVQRVRLTCFIISSTLAAVAGILLASRNNGITPSTGGGQTLLYAVGAAVIGGTSLFGGKGRVVDAIFGGLAIAVIDNGMGLLNQPSSTVFIVTGIVLLLAASVDAISRRRAAATGR